MSITHQAETAAIDYLIERGGSIFTNEAPEKSVFGMGRIIAGRDVYDNLSCRGIVKINTNRNQGDAIFGDTIEMVASPSELMKAGR